MDIKKVIKMISGIIGVVLGALLLADGVLELMGVLVDPFFSSAIVKVIVGIIALTLASNFVDEDLK